MEIWLGDNEGVTTQGLLILIAGNRKVTIRLRKRGILKTGDEGVSHSKSVRCI